MKFMFPSMLCLAVFWDTFKDGDSATFLRFLLPVFDDPRSEKCSFPESWNLPFCNYDQCLLSLQGHVAGSFSSCCPACPFLQSCSLPSWSLACTDVWGYSSPDARLCIYSCTLNIFYKPFSLSCKGFSDW